VTRYVASTRVEARAPPARAGGWTAATRKLFFGSVGSSLTTVLLALACAALAWHLFTWGVRDAVFSAAGAPQSCRAPGAGACWAVLGEKLRLILFGTYPYAQQWRPAVAMLLLVAMYCLSVQPRLWNWRLPLAWGIVLCGFAVLMFGGVFGLAYVPDDQWGGLPVTLILATLGLVFGFALAIPLALIRHAPGGGIGKALVVACIELARSVPLLAVLFLASVMIPLFLPQDISISKLLRVIIAFALFTSAYLAEVMRGGLLSVPRGQREAAAALGLTPFVATTRIVLPQALTTVLPALVNVFIAFFKATSIVVVIGIFDLMTAAKRAAADSQWEGFGTEIYLFVALIYFAFCFALSRYSARLQAARDPGRGR
jgi:general L-amino acid transport system permease protein